MCSDVHRCVKNSQTFRPVQSFPTALRQWQCNNDARVRTLHALKCLVEVDNETAGSRFNDKQSNICGFPCFRVPRTLMIDDMRLTCLRELILSPRNNQRHSVTTARPKEKEADRLAELSRVNFNSPWFIDCPRDTDTSRRTLLFNLR